ncbi:MAG: adenylyltransferase/cytidyltransferase family protein [Candidatus Paceibacterota bacterium]
MPKKLKTIKNKKTLKPKKIVMVSGGFDPIHIGHIRMFQEAKKLGDKLIVLINNDNWLRAKKGKEFMSEEDRKEIIEALECVDEVYLTDHDEKIDFNHALDRSVCSALNKIRPHIFANGGDRFADDIPEFQMCNELGIEMVFNVGHGGKVRSSSDLVKSYTTPKVNKKKN